MIGGKKVLGIIPARGGSKGVPYKNIRDLAGKPLIAWIIEAAKRSVFLDRLILSSDDDMIIKKAIEYGCEVPFVRPANLATDQSKNIDVVLHAQSIIHGYDLVVSLQPTSPLVLPSDIDGCIELMVKKNAKSSISVTEPEKSPYWMLSISDDSYIHPIIDKKYLLSKRQELPKAYVPNGAIYVAETEWLIVRQSYYSEDTVGYVMPRERSYDLDTEMDFIILDTLLRVKDV